MLRKSHIIVLALVAAAVAAPLAQAGQPAQYTPSQIKALKNVWAPPPKPVDPLAVSILLGKGYNASQIATMTGGYVPVSTPTRPVDPLALKYLQAHAVIVSILRSKGYSASQIAAMTGVAIAVSTPPKVDPLAVSYLQSLGLTPSEVTDWTTGACSHEVKAASCFAVFDRSSTEVASTSDGFAWGDAGIGAAASLGVILLVMGLGLTLITRGRRQAGQPRHV